MKLGVGVRQPKAHTGFQKLAFIISIHFLKGRSEVTVESYSFYYNLNLYLVLPVKTVLHTEENSTKCIIIS